MCCPYQEDGSCVDEGEDERMGKTLFYSVYLVDMMNKESRER